MERVQNTRVLITQLWEELERKTSGENNQGRIYRRFGPTENGIRVACTFPEHVWEMIIQIGKKDEANNIEFPDWQGMGFEKVCLSVPNEGTIHVRIFLNTDGTADKDIFITVCADLVDSLNSCKSNSDRLTGIKAFLIKWSRFFDRHGRLGMSQEQQRGLFGELWFLRRTILEGGVSPRNAVAAWKGCERGYHDFDFKGHVVEVKTTMSKEPRRVKISNERQLDDSGLCSLHLFVMTLSKADSGGETLPKIVASLRAAMSDTPVLSLFEQSLQDAGFLDIHSQRYSGCYAALKEELFHVQEGFPRIITIPPGTGDLSYSVVISACMTHEIDLPAFITTLGALNYGI